MDVFVIPVGPDRYELYCEQPVPGRADRAGDRGIHRQTAPAVWRDRSGGGRTSAQRPGAGCGAEELDRPDAGSRHGVGGRAHRRAAAALEPARADDGNGGAPADMTFEQVDALIRESLQRDYDRHRRWMYIDGVLFVVTFIVLFPLVVIPGVANLPALYFGFRAIGHFLSMRGTLNGLRNVAWRGRPCPPLDELRELALQEPHRSRGTRLRDVAARVRLEHLPKFFDRVAIQRS